MPVLVYEKPKAVYYAVEKCAITRLIWYFGSTYSFNTHKKVAEEIFFPAKKSFSSATKLSQVVKKYPDYLTFAFIRNPFDRIVSNYFFNLGSWTKRYGKDAPSFEDYVMNQKHWSTLKPLSWHLDIDPKFIGHYESFRNDFDKLNEMLGTKNYTDENHPLNKVANKSSRKKHYREYYDKKTRKKIEQDFVEDFKRFGYKF